VIHLSISTLILLFFSYSFIGWLFEVVLCSIRDRKYVTRGFLIGPICPIYGCGGVVMTLVAQPLKQSVLFFFLVCVVLCSILEYITSYILEKIFKARWWDYSQFKLNINGRISLITSCAFGILGCLLIYGINPSLIKLYSKISMPYLSILTIILVITFIIDIIISFRILKSIKVSKQKKADNTEEITKQVKEKIKKCSHKRINR